MQDMIGAFTMGLGLERARGRSSSRPPATRSAHRFAEQGAGGNAAPVVSDWCIKPVGEPMNARQMVRRHGDLAMPSMLELDLTKIRE